MDEWMQLTGGEAAYRQQSQRAMRQSASTPQRSGSGRRVRAALAAALLALAARVAPAPSTPPPANSPPLAHAQS